MENKQANPMGNMPTDPMEIFKAMSERERQAKINRFRILNHYTFARLKI